MALHCIVLIDSDEREYVRKERISTAVGDSAIDKSENRISKD